MMIAALLPGMSAAAAPSYPFSMTNADWNRTLEAFTTELKTLDTDSRVPKAGEVIKTRGVILARYAQLYSKVSETAAVHHASQLPEPDTWSDCFDTFQFPGRRAIQLGIRDAQPDAIYDASTRDLEAAEAEVRRHEANEQLGIYMKQLQFDEKLNTFRSRVAGEMGGYCGYAFELNEKDAKDKIISANISDPRIRKHVRELLLLAPYKPDPQPGQPAPKPDPEEQRRNAMRQKERWDALMITMSVTSHPRFQQVILSCTEPYGPGHGLHFIALGSVGSEDELASLKELVISKHPSFQVEYHVVINSAFETDAAKIAMARAKARYTSQL